MGRNQPVRMGTRPVRRFVTEQDWFGDRTGRFGNKSVTDPVCLPVRTGLVPNQWTGRFQNRSDQFLKHCVYT